MLETKEILFQFFTFFTTAYGKLLSHRVDGGLFRNAIPMKSFQFVLILHLHTDITHCQCIAPIYLCDELHRPADTEAR